jgi:hypothetical protein
VASFITRPLYYRGKCSLCPSNRNLGEIQSWFGHFREEKNFLSVFGFELWRVKVKYTLPELHVTEKDQLSRYHVRFWAPRPLCRPKFLLVSLNPGAHKSWIPGHDNKLFTMAPNIFIIVNAVLSLIQKTDRQRAYKLSLRRLQKQKVCVCSLRYPACNAHALYCHMWPVRLYDIFTHYLINGTIFENKLLNMKHLFVVFSKNFVWNISHSKENWGRYDQKYILVFM